MDFETFKEAVKKAKTKEPLLFELKHDNIPTMKKIIAFQKNTKLF